MQNKPFLTVVVIFAVLMVAAAVSRFASRSPRAGQKPGVLAPESAQVVESPPAANVQSASAAPAKAQHTDSDEGAEASGEIIEVNESNFAAEVTRADKPVIIDFWADWCQPCHMVKPVLEQLAAEYAGKLKFVAIDVDANPKLAKQFKVAYLPTVVIIDNGTERERAVGVLPPEQLRDKITTVLSSEQ